MQTDITQTSSIGLSNVTEFKVLTQETDGIGSQKETITRNENWTKYLGYYKEIPEYKTAINAFATWVIGKGWKASDRDTAILEGITGWGEDSFLSILWNMIAVKKFARESFAEIIRNKKTGTLINLKPLSPGSMATITNGKGVLIRYEQESNLGGNVKIRRFKPERILHLVNDRIADETHGTSITESIEWVILARNEAMRDWKRISHRSTVRVLYIDEDDKTRLNNLKRDYADAIDKGEVMIIPAKKGEAEFEDLDLPPVDAFLSWIRYLEDVFYKSLGVPKIILGGGSFPEGDSKISYLTFEQVYIREVEELKADLWNQLAIRVEFSPPVSLKDQVQETEVKNSSQTGFQSNDTTAGVGE